MAVSAYKYILDMMHYYKTYRAMNKKLLLAALMLCFGTVATAQVQVKGSVFGGGNLANVEGNSSVKVSQNGAKISKDVYGGGALADVVGTATVQIDSGTVDSNVYGGGLGRKAKEAEGTEGQPGYKPAVSAIAATVGGVVRVNIGHQAENGDYAGDATIGGEVFGCNNLNGSPKNNVFVDIWKTARGGNKEVGDNNFSDIETFKAALNADNSVWHTAPYFALQAVYGGGNEATYLPDVEYNDQNKLIRHTINVHIHGCENTVKMVYGGGRAADAGCKDDPATTGSGQDKDSIKVDILVIVDGGRIDTLFGGGDGHTLAEGHSASCVDHTPANNDIYHHFRAADIYGNAAAEIHGGLFTAAFAGSNTAGDIHGGKKSLEIDNNSGCGNEFIVTLFGGANEAVTHGDVELTVGCGVGDIGELYGGSNKAEIIDGDVTLNIRGGRFTDVFGGSRGVADRIAANIRGNVTLNLYGGTITNAFGGSDKNGNITGTITVNVFDLEENNCALHVDNIYGGGNETPYDPDEVEGQKPVSPVVNVIHAGSGITGSVYGGAKGSTAEVKANPLVNFGFKDDAVVRGTQTMSQLVSKLIPSDLTSYSTSSLTDYPNASVTGNVYGGGDAAPVTGNTVVLVQNAKSHAAEVFGGGNNISGNKGVSGTATVNMSAGTVTDGLYGGCNENGVVDSNIFVNIIGGTVGTKADTTANVVYGGGYGHATKTKGNVEVTIGTASAGPAIYGNVYGGSALGSVNGTAANADKHTYVTVKKDTIHGNVFGGGLGKTDAPDSGCVYGPVAVNLEGGVVMGSVFGCNNTYGSPQKTVAVNINNGVVKRNVFGGGNLAPADISPVVTISNGEVDTVFGGGNKAGVGNSGSITLVTVKGGKVNAGVYGGCNTSGTVTGMDSVSIVRGTIGASDATANIYGGGLGEATRMKGDVKVVIGKKDHTGATIYGDVYGGSAKGKTNCNDEGTAHEGTTKTDVTLYSTLNGSLFGGGHGLDNASADVWGPVTVTVDSGYVTGAVYGANNLAGAPQNGITVNIIATSQAIPEVYGGGNMASCAQVPHVNILGGTVAKVYGGGKGDESQNKAADVAGSQVTINGNKTQVTTGIYGGCNAKGTVTGDAIVNIYGGQVGAENNRAQGIFGGGFGSATAVNGNVTVTLNGTTAKVYSDLYGGSALGSVNDAAGDNTTVNILNGEITGNIFGGGLGDQSIAAIVNGVVHVNIGATDGAATPTYSGDAIINGNVYGCNNINGSPQADVHVDVYKAHRVPGITTKEADQFSIPAVFGGGCQADYAPEDNTDLQHSTSDKKIYTKVHGCDNTIENIYGGGDRASVLATNLEIDGGHFNWAFGGGNGMSVPANVGKGGINLVLHGGHFGFYHVGSNLMGQNFGKQTIDTTATDNYCDELDVDNFYFGQNEAALVGDLHDTIWCGHSKHFRNLYGGSRLATIEGNIELVIMGGNFDNVYGGSEGNLEHPADITGNITIKLLGGKIGRVYGGNNKVGNVTGNITIIVDSNQSNTCALEVDYIYGGSNLAQYSPTMASAKYPNYSPLVELKAGHVNHDVFGGGRGADTNVMSGLVTSNPKVWMHPVADKFWVKGNIYGGGELANVGDFNYTDGKPTSSKTANSGNATVVIESGKVGPEVLTMPKDSGMVFGGGKGISGDPKTKSLYPKLNYTATTDVTISGSAFIKGSVYGGSQNGHVLDSTYVKIQGGQIGAGDGLDVAYADDKFINPTTTTVTTNNALAECNSWTYGSPFAPYDPFAKTTGDSLVYYPTNDTTYGGRHVASDGHTFYGNVFGGGSGYFPYAPGKWLESAGVVYGNTRVEITDGHILTNIYGGNELTNVGTYNTDGSCKAGTGVATVIMSGGSLGVPRTEESITHHPVTGYLFGGGKGDQRTPFDTWTNVNSAYVKVSGGWIYGSVFGGAEDGHVKRNVKVVIGQDAGKTTIIGTRGTSYVDGNIFGGGRGFSGEDVTEGLVAGNIDVEITGGTMLGSIYGGGRLASVGLNAANGQMQSGKEHGHITVNISGGTIGNGNVANTDHSGNVFGSSMGRLTKLDNTKNPHWPGLAHAKQTKVNISGGTIQKNVYGGGEIGFVRDSAIVNITGGQIQGIVYGGGFGSDDATKHANDFVKNVDDSAKYTAAVLAGRVYGHTMVNVTGGTVSHDIYGGGEMASVGNADSTMLGNTTVNIGYIEGGEYKGSATIGGNVYGANNIAGSPFGNTRVNIYGTAHTTSPENNTIGGDKYAIANVFGGGHLANYTPKHTNNRAYVHVYGCDNTIGSLFGGGDAAAVYGAKDTIDGGRFHFIFGGGNGESRAADIGAGGTGLVVQGGTIDSLFGGSNILGSINGPVSTVLNNKGCSTEQIGVFFAGSNKANINQSLVTNIDCGVKSITEIYGGCHLADITGDVTLNIKGGTFTRVFAGSKGKLGDTPAAADSANISGRVTLNLHGGIIDTAFGGSNVNGNITGQIIVNVEDTSSNCQLQLDQVYGGGKDAAYTPSDTTLASPQVNIKHIRRDGGISGDVNGGGLGSTAIVTANPFVTIGDNVDGHTAVVTGDVFGGGEEAAVTGTTKVEMHKGTVGYIFGGGDKANVSGATTVNIKGGTVQHDVYGGGALSETGGTNVTLNGVVADNTKVLGDIYGGGRGKQAEGNDASTAVGANVNGKVWVTVTSGSARNVYGCNNFFGFPTDTVTVRVNGADATVSNVYGGGNLADARWGNTNNATRSIVNFSLGNVQNVFGGGHAASTGYSIVNIAGGTIANGVYGGCESSGDVKFDATVNLTGGTIGTTGTRADVFGGGLGNGTNVFGDVTVNCGGSSTTHNENLKIYGDLYGGSAYGTVNTYNANKKTTVNVLNGILYGDVYGGGMGHADHIDWGKVNGVITVNVGGKIVDSLYGQAYIRQYDNNTKGGNIFGGNNIKGSPQDNIYVNIYQTHQEENVNTRSDEGYAIDQVFGGGNHADCLASSTDSVTTNIHGCYNTIRRVFGGGNAAATKKTSVNIDGGRFDKVYGGGNGEVTAANIDGDIYLRVHGGAVNQTTGGSNHSGTISGTLYQSFDNSGCDTLKVDEHFCGGEDADPGQDIITTFSCNDNSQFGSLYGGCKYVTLTGNVKLTIEGGKFTNVYGGSKGDRASLGTGHTDRSADISGNVNLLIKGGEIDNAFGGCNVLGNIAGKITVTVDTTDHDNSCPLTLMNVYGGGRDASYTPDPNKVGAAKLYPEVNIVRGRVQNNVFGGGLGTDAIVQSNPVVMIGDATSGHGSYVASVGGNVYGGGDKAAVDGNTSVTIQQSNSSAINLFGGGNQAQITGTATVNVNGGTVTKGVYGGCNSSDTVKGVIAVNINGGTIGAQNNHADGIFGGGLGVNTRTTNNVEVTIGNISLNTTPTIYGDVYGGSALGIDSIGGGSDLHTYVTLNKGAVHGNIYGGGLGNNSIEAKVYTPVFVKVYGGTADSVFGCNNIKGAPQDTVAVDIYGTDNATKALKAVFGGGNKAAYSYTKAPTVTVHNCSSKIGTVYGGGNAAQVPATNVTVYGGSIDTVFGGGNGKVQEAPVNGNSVVNIYGGAADNVFGGNNASGNITGTIEVTINEQAETEHPLCPMAVGNVYGGGNLAVYDPTASDIFSPKVTILSGTIDGTVYGGGKGIENSLTAGMVKSNTLVDMRGGTVKHSIYGGGELASVGDINFTNSTCKSGTGLTKVLISGGVVGDINNARMPSTTNPEGDDYGYVFCGGKGVVDSVAYPNANRLALVDSTYLEISGAALITASVYGGCENGMTLGNTHVKISGGQIGTGHYTTKEGNTVTHHWDAAYSEEQWTAAKNAVVNDTMGRYISSNPFHECDHFPFGVIPTGGDKPEYNVYDIYAGDGSYHPAEASKIASNGHSFYGNVFGGGSGFYPFWDSTGTDATKYKSTWRRTAGRVNGNTLVEITGGHILTGVYGGNEYTDVLGHSTVKMSGGTLGVPRSLESIEAHPVTCYLFGAGMGDPRTGFNTWTTVDSVYVEVSGGIIYGSVFGGGEDGHVKRNVNVVVKDNAIIGTWGTSYVDGNVFGGGRGFKSDALTAGVVAGNVTVDIQGGTMLGSIYGGGRLASVGTHLVDVNDEYYGKMQENEEHGFITVNVSGGTIGNNYEFVYVDPNTEINNTWRANNHLPHTEFDDNKRVSHTKGGNVFGGPMGRLEKIASTEKNPLWSRLGMAKQTKVNISGSAMVKGSVYGGSELGTLTDNAEVTVSGGTIGTPIKNGNDIKFYYGSVYGGGYGSDRLDIENVVDSAGRVFGNTTVYLKDNGEVRNNIYGGGDLASVTGSATVIVTGGKVGPIDALHRSGNVYGAGKGKDDEAYKLYSNVASTLVTVSGGEIAGDVYGGGADAHVIGNTSVNITTGSHIGTDGLSGYDGNIFGGGRGSGKQTTPGDRTTFKVNPTCGRVGGNTSVTMDGGVIQGSIFGGGRLALVGVDVDGTLAKHIVSSYYDSVKHGMATINISGGHIGNPNGDELLNSDYSIGDIFGSGKGDGVDSNDVLAGRVMNTQVTVSGTPRIYGSVFGGGEMAGIGWWDETGVNKGLFYDRTGSATVTVNNCDTIGTKREFETDYITNPDSWTITNHAGRLVHSCTGNVIGGSQGDAATSPYEGTNEYKTHWVSMGRSRTATVTIGGGHILGEVFGGAEQGTVRGNTRVNINGGIIGTLIGTGSDAYYFGSVYGGGYGSNDVSEPHNDSSMRAVQIAGRVYGNTSVSVNGGTVKGSVYGGGSYASVGDLTFNDNSLATNCTAGTGIATVSVTGGTIGVTGVGNGNVYGSSRGDAVVPESQLDDQAWVDSSSVTVSGSAKVKGNVFGGGENGHVLGNAVVSVSGGTIGCTETEYASLSAAEFAERGNVYGGGAGVEMHTDGAYNLMSGIVMGNTKVTVEGGYISRNVYGGGDMASVGTFNIEGYNTDTAISFVLSWPVRINYTSGGDTRVEIFGGHIGTVTASSTAGGDVYGSSRGKVGYSEVFSKLANVNNTTDSINFTPSADDTIVGNVYGSGENGHVYGDTRVVLVNGTVGGSVYGGGKGADTYSASTWIQTPSGWIKDHVDVHSLTAGKVFGNTHVVVGGGQVMKNVYGGGNMASVGKGNYNGFGEHSSNANDTANTGRCYVNIYGGNIGTDGNENGHVFGASKGFAFVPVEALPEGGHLYDYCRDFFMSYVNKTYVTIGNPGDNASDPKVKGSVFGGSENGHVRYDACVRVNRGEIGVELKDTIYNQFRSDYFTAHTTGTPTKTDTANMNAAFAKMLTEAPWAYRGNVFGAGRGMGTYKDANNQDQYNPTSGSVTGSTRVDINGGTVHRNVYGGGSLASVGQNIGFPVENSCCVVNMNSNTGGQYYKTLDYGGYTIGGSRGLASPNATDGNGKSVFIYEDYAVCANTQVNIMEGANALKQSCYGGGEFGRVSGKAQVNVIGGDINTIYCGGKGAWGEAAGCENDSVAGQVGTTELNLLRGTVKYVYGGCRRALVSGDAIVNVGKDNGDGTYSGDITVTGAVYGCNRYKGSPKGDVYVNVYKTAHTATDSATFDGAAPTTPTYAIPKVFGGGAEANYEPEDGKQIHLTVYSCDNTIQDLFGGGDAALVTNTTTIINGGRFDRVFAGGNGDKKRADVTGTANLTVRAGLIRQLFGGSNRQGSVRNSVVTISHDDNTGCPEDIDEYFGGGNEADITGDIATTIECGAKFRSVYGGSNKADITGNVTLNINGGTIDNVYGGSKGETDPGESASQGLRDTAAANITGNVTLNIYGGKIIKAFGGSNINGNITGKIEVNVDWKESPCDQQLDTVFGGSNLAAYTPTTPGDYPEVNIKNVNTSTIKDVFGGGLGQPAVVTSNPKVTIGVPTDDSKRVTVTNVFGGGDLADVVGTTTVLVQKSNSRVTYLYGGGNADTVGGTQVFVTAGTIDTLFGGGRGDNTSGNVKRAKVKGNDTVSISGGRIFKAFAGSNLNGDITGRMHLRVDKSGSDSLFIGEVYGGGNHAAGHAGTITIGCTGKLVTPTTGKRHGYELEGISVVYGGANEADVTSDIHLTVASGVVDSVFGGNNKTGDIAGKIYVTIDSTAAATDVCGRYIGYVFGGGNRAPYGDTTEVNVKGGTVTHHVFGGGNQAGVKGSYVKMEGGTVKEDVYGGCNTSGTVTTTAAVTITNGTVKGSVYGGGLGIDTRVGESTTKPGKTVIDISGNATKIGNDVYGGGNEGKVYGETEVKIH